MHVVTAMKIRLLLVISTLCCGILPSVLHAQEEASIDSLVSLLESTEGEEHLKILSQLSENMWLSYETG